MKKPSKNVRVKGFQLPFVLSELHKLVTASTTITTAMKDVEVFGLFPQFKTSISLHFLTFKELQR